MLIALGCSEVNLSQGKGGYIPLSICLLCSGYIWLTVSEQYVVTFFLSSKLPLVFHQA